MKKIAISFILVLFMSGGVFAETEMLGPLTKGQILSGVPDWEAVAAAYQPNAEAIARLKADNRPILIEVYLGTWCPDSKANVSAFFKILDMTDNPYIQTAYVGLPRDKAVRVKYIPEGKNIVKLPTFILSIDGQEKGRIIENPAKSVEADLISFLEK
jgi:hypothetical protein